MDIPVVNGFPNVWNADDVTVLRSVHRIVGNLIGCDVRQTYQNKEYGLPLQLLPEEATLLRNEGIIRLVEYKRLSEAPSDEEKSKFKNYKESCFNQQNERYKELRKATILSMADQISTGVMKKREGKLIGKRQRRKLKRKATSGDPNDDDDDRNPAFRFDANNGDLSAQREKCDSGDASSTEDIIESLISKIPDISKSSCLVHTPTECPWLTSRSATDYNWKFPSSYKETLRYRVYEDLWKKKYYITTGTSFGGDYLVYPGDPMHFHAVFIIVCLNEDEELSGKDLACYGRIGNNVKKTTVLCSLNRRTNQIVYTSLNFKSFKS